MELELFGKELEKLADQTIRPAASKPIGNILRQPSQNPVVRMKKNLFWDFLTATAALLYLVIFYWVGYDGKLWIGAVFFLLVLFAISIYFFKKRKLLNAMLDLGCSVKTHLDKQLAALQRYIRWYTLWSVLFLPVSILQIFLLAYNYHPQLLTSRRTVFYWLSDTYVLPTSLVLIALVIAIYFYNRWIIHRRYGRHIQSLTELIREMDEK